MRPERGRRTPRPPNYLTLGLLALFLLTATGSSVRAQAPADEMDINALKTRYAGEKTKHAANKEVKENNSKGARQSQE